MKFTIWDNSSSRFFLVPSALGEFDGMFWSQFSFFTWKILFSDKNLEIHPFFDFLLGFSTAPTSLKKHVLPNLRPVSDLSF